MKPKNAVIVVLIFFFACLVASVIRKRITDMTGSAYENYNRALNDIDDAVSDGIILPSDRGWVESFLDELYISGELKNEYFDIVDWYIDEEAIFRDYDNWN